MRRSTNAFCHGLRAAEAAALPPHDSVRGYDHERFPPAGPQPGQDHPEQAIGPPELRPVRGPLVHRQLLAQGDVLEGQLTAAPEEEGAEAE